MKSVFSIVMVTLFLSAISSSISAQDTSKCTQKDTTACVKKCEKKEGLKCCKYKPASKTK